MDVSGSAGFITDLQISIWIIKSSDARRDLSRVLNHPNRYLFGYDYIVHGLNRRAMKATVYAKEKEPWKLNAAEGNIDLFFMLLKNLRGKKPSDF